MAAPVNPRHQHYDKIDLHATKTDFSINAFRTLATGRE
jgi:hypothetical protein